MSAIDVEISIVNHENRELVGACLRSLPAACNGLMWHATVVDNVSGDGSLEMLASEFPDVAVVANTVRNGFGANHNKVLGPLVERSGARYALVLNDDTELRPGAVRHLVAAADRDPRIGALAPTIVDPNGNVAANRIAYPSVKGAVLFDLARQMHDVADEHGFLQGCCLLVRVDTLAEVGLFDERYYLFFEDADLSRRLEDAGWRLATCPDATVVHQFHASVFQADVVKLTPKQGLRSRYLYMCRHLGRGRAELASWAGRACYLARWAKARIEARVRRDPVRRSDAADFLELARLDPRRPLDAEVRAKGK